MSGTAATPRLRNARACELCRISKSRCIYSQEKDICRRCEQHGSECIVRTKARPMRARIGSSAQPSQLSPSASPSASVVLDLPALPSQDLSEDIDDLESHHKAAFHDEENGRSMRSSVSTPSVAPVLLRPRKVTLERAQAWLHTFRRMSIWFPFVTIPPEATVSSLARDSPFVLLAVLTVSAKSDPNFYYQLDHEFRRILSQKIVVEGQKTLELMQGLLVYLAWTPMPSGIKQNHTFTYLNMATGLMSDLGLDEDTPDPHRFPAIDDKDLVKNGQFTRVAKEAALGVQYLITTLTTVFQKFRNVQSPVLQDLTVVNLDLEHHPTAELYHILTLNVFWERIIAASFANGRLDQLEGASLSPEMRLQVALSELQEIIRLTPNSPRNRAMISLQERFARVIIYAYHLDLGWRRQLPHHKQPPKPKPENISADLQCLEACKGFFEYMLSIPAEDYHCLTIVQWSFMAQAFVVLSRLTFTMAADLGWDSDTARQNVPMSLYLESFCWRFEKLSTTSEQPGGTPKNPDWLYIMRRVLETLNRSYSKRIAEIIPPNAPAAPLTVGAEFGGTCPMKETDFTTFLEAAFTQPPSNDQSPRSLDETSSRGSSNTPMYFDIWSTMTGSWAQQDR